MRLSSEALEIIQQLFAVYFNKNDELWLFGSRIDPNKRGGDIDLYVETTITNFQLAFEKKLKFVVALKIKLGDQKIDIVINVKSANYNLPIYAIAKNEGIRLV